MTDAPSALAMVLISSSGRGSAHATCFATPGLPLNRVGESCGMRASFASSTVSALPCSASATALTGSFQIAAPLSINAAPTLRTIFMTPEIGCNNSASGSSEALRRLRAGAARNGIAGGPFGAASVIDINTLTSAMPSA